MEDEERNEEIKKIPINHIVPNRFQPRTVFNEEKIEELSRTFIHMELFNQLLSENMNRINLKLLQVNVDSGQ